jgi:hypothetical protein
MTVFRDKKMPPWQSSPQGFPCQNHLTPLVCSAIIAAQGSQAPLRDFDQLVEGPWPISTSCPPRGLWGRGNAFWWEKWSKHPHFGPRISISWSKTLSISPKFRASGPHISTRRRACEPCSSACLTATGVQANVRARHIGWCGPTRPYIGWCGPLSPCYASAWVHALLLAAQQQQPQPNAAELHLMLPAIACPMRAMFHTTRRRLVLDLALELSLLHA